MYLNKIVYNFNISHLPIINQKVKIDIIAARIST